MSIKFYLYFWKPCIFNEADVVTKKKIYSPIQQRETNVRGIKFFAFNVFENLREL